MNLITPAEWWGVGWGEREQEKIQTSLFTPAARVLSSLVLLEMLKISPTAHSCTPGFRIQADEPGMTMFDWVFVF